MVSPGSDDEGGEISKDKHGDPFRDFGFLQRAEDHKAAGNACFGKSSYVEALTEYDAALQLLLTVAEDKSIVLGQKKWDEVVILRSLVHLNKSACFSKLGRWREAVAEASSCLLGNIPVETKCTHPHIMANAKPSNIPEVDPRLASATRAKAWFRMSEGYLRLGHFSRAKHAAAKALKLCEKKSEVRSLVLRHSKKIVALAKRDKEVQKRNYKDYWDKFEEEGGYVEKDLNKRGQTKVKREALSAADKLHYMDTLDSSDGEGESVFEGFADEGVHSTSMLTLEDGGLALGAQERDPLQQVRRRRQEEEIARGKAWEERRGMGGASKAPSKAKQPKPQDSDDD